MRKYIHPGALAPRDLGGTASRRPSRVTAAALFRVFRSYHVVASIETRGFQVHGRGR